MHYSWLPCFFPVHCLLFNVSPSDLVHRSCQPLGPLIPPKLFFFSPSNRVLMWRPCWTLKKKKKKVEYVLVRIDNFLFKGPEELMGMLPAVFFFFLFYPLQWWRCRKIGVSPKVKQQQLPFSVSFSRLTVWIRCEEPPASFTGAKQKRRKKGQAAW